MELLTIALAANQTQQFAKAGTYFEVTDADYPVTIDFTGQNGSLTDTMRNALSGLYLEDPYSSFSITNGATAQTVRVLVMENGRGGSRRQPGVVSVVDGGKARTLAGVAGFGSVASAAAATFRSYVQIWNPPASTNRLVVESVFLSSPTAGSFELRTHNAALVTLNGSPLSKRNQDILSSIEFRSNNTSAATFGQGLINTYLQAATTLQLSFKEPLILDPGFGCLAVPVATNVEIRAGWEFYLDPL